MCIYILIYAHAWNTLWVLRVEKCDLFAACCRCLYTRFDSPRALWPSYLLPTVCWYTHWHRTALFVSAGGRSCDRTWFRAGRGHLHPTHWAPGGANRNRRTLSSAHRVASCQSQETAECQQGSRFLFVMLENKCECLTSFWHVVITASVLVLLSLNSFITNVDMVALYNNVTLLSLIKVITSDSFIIYTSLLYMPFILLSISKL